MAREKVTSIRQRRIADTQSIRRGSVAKPNPDGYDAITLAELNAAQRKRLKKSQFALPSKRSKSGGSGGYPINDASHARNALARVAQHGTPAEKARVRAAVARKFPGIGKSKKAPKGGK